MIVYRELSSLERDLGFPASTLYAVSNRLNRHYRKVELPKGDGTLRTLSVPDNLLKTIQRRIAQVLLSTLPVSPYATAYRPGGSVVKNARPHVGKPVVLKLDIYHFFDAVCYSRVKKEIFPPEIYSEQNRILLSMLCCYQDRLPQGAPTSPAISNRILLDFDQEIGKWCARRGISYTRYCDDLTFSGDFAPGDVIRFVRERLKVRGFLLNNRKIQVLRQGQRQSVTGVVVNQSLQAPANLRRELRQQVYYCRKFGVSDHLARTKQTVSEEDYLRRLLGQVNFALQINPADQELADARQWLVAEIRRKRA